MAKHFVPVTYLPSYLATADYFTMHKTDSNAMQQSLVSLLLMR